MLRGKVGLAPHDPDMCWKQFMLRLKGAWFVAAFHSTPVHDPGPVELQRPARVCVCKGATHRTFELRAALHGTLRYYTFEKPQEETEKKINHLAKSKTTFL